MIDLAKGVIKKTRLLRYHNNHKKEAYKALKNIEYFSGKLGSNLKKKCDNYAVKKLGSKKYAPWLYVYSAISDNFYEGWVPDNYYGSIIVPKLNGQYGKIANRKALTNILLESDLFPDLLYSVNGLFLTVSQTILPKKEAIKTLSKSNNKIVFKLEGSSQGRGVKIINPMEYNFNNIPSLGNGVFQSFINQHSFFSEIEPSSVATIRMTTAIDSYGVASLRGCYLRVGRTSDKIMKASSNLRIEVNRLTGKLSEYAYTPEWRRIGKHPDTNCEFKGKKLPSFKESKEKILNLHSKVPFIRIIGWDLIIDDNNNIQVMEFNGGHNDIKFSEATQGPIFKDFDLENLWKEK